MFMQFRPRPTLPMVLGAVAAVVFCAQLSAGALLRVDIGEVSGSQGLTVEVPVTLYGAEGASTIVFGVAFDHFKLQLVSVMEGSGLTPSQWVEQGTVENGVAPLAVSTLGGVIGEGEICVLTFRVLSANTEVLDLTGSGTPSAATPTGAKITVDVVGGEVVTNCTGSGAQAPSGVTASTDQSDGVLVSWDAAAGASEYRVYRANKNTPEAVEAVSGWMQGTSWLDVTAAPPGTFETLPMGCLQGPDNTVLDSKYYYWVRGRDDAGCPGDYSDAAEGWRVFGKAAEMSAGVVGTRRGDILLFAVVTALLCVGALLNKRFSGMNG